MEETKFRKAMKIFFREYQRVTGEMDALVANLAAGAPVPRGDKQRALEIFREELEQSRLLPVVKSFLRKNITTDSF